MTTSLFLSVLAICTGFVAGIFFCIGAILTTPKKASQLATTRYGYNGDLAKAIVSQSAQYAVGGILLIISFSFQVGAILADSTNQIELYLVIDSTLKLIAFIVGGIFLLSLGICYAINILLYKITEKHLDQRTNKAPSPEKE